MKTPTASGHSEDRPLDTVASQEQLRELLKAEGFDVTQATLSRRHPRVGLAKIAAPDGGSGTPTARDRASHPTGISRSSCRRCWFGRRRWGVAGGESRRLARRGSVSPPMRRVDESSGRYIDEPSCDSSASAHGAPVQTRIKDWPEFAT